MWSQKAFRGAIATVVIVLAMVCPATTAGNPPVKLGGEVAVSSYAPEIQYNPEIARRPDGKWVVAWDSNNQDGDQYGVYMQMYNSDRTPLGSEVQLHTNTESRQIFPRIAIATDNSFVIVWHSSHTGTMAIQSQRLSSTGAKIGGEFKVNTGTAPTYHADVAFLTNGDVVYCWREAVSGDMRTMMRRYNSAFAPLTGAVEVNPDPTQTTQYAPRIAALTGGGFVIAYYGRHDGSDMSEVKAQVYDAAGAPIGTSFQVNTFTENMQGRPYVAALPDGSFILAWDSNGQDGDLWGCYARHYSATGATIGPLITVNTITESYQQRPKVATFSDNSFVITWYTTRDATSGDHDIVIQYFDASHNKIGPETTVNTYLPAGQWQPAIASNWNDGDFGVVYISRNFQSGTSDYDVAGQWFTVDIAPPPPPLPTECTSACLRYFCKEGSLIDVKVKGVVTNDVWGSAYFTDDSNVATAAVFAGLVAAGETATVTVKCSGPKSSFTSGSANGVTTQAFASSWPSSFTFDLGGETQPPQPPAPERCSAEPCAVGRCVVQGTSFNLVVRGSVTSNIWGSLSFSDDSSVGTAAVHQGVLQAGATGSVTVSCVGPRASLTGTTRNGVTSNDFGPWQYTYTLSPGPTAPPTADEHTCTGECLEGKCPENDVFFLRVAGTTYGYLWGSSPYSDDTTVAAAAVHAGLVSAGAVAIVKATCTGAQSSFTASTQNAVTTSSYGPWSASFTLSAGTDMPTLTCGPGWPCLISLCKVTGHVFKVSVTGSAAVGSQIWGTVHYTDDSPVSHAAVHSGLVADGETKLLYATCEGGQPSFTGTTAFGVTSESWTAWPASYTLSATQ